MKKSLSKIDAWLQKLITDKKLLLETYIDCEYVSADDERFYLNQFHGIRKRTRDVFGARLGATILGESDIAGFSSMPTRLRLYRGYYEVEKREGISWSLSRKIAEGFAYSNWNYKNEAPQVVTGTCLLSRALAYTNDRSEQEFIVDPKDVCSIRNIKVRAKPSFPVTAEPLEELLKGHQHHGSEVLRTV